MYSRVVTLKTVVWVAHGYIPGDASSLKMDQFSGLFFSWLDKPHML
ncbi:Uncharacterised protein [Legionella spiritensis]|nr:Uncharacterised protein [Legionella spiritensis]VEG92075.1 Uncharacterised protein [Legionella spiritensis]